MDTRWLAGLGLAVAALAPSAGQAQDFCWRDSYGRGVGTIPGACNAGDDHIGPLCYAPCPAGMARESGGVDCLSICPQGMADQGLFCRATEYGRGAGYGWEASDGLSNDGMMERCERDNGAGDCEMCGPIAYPKCKPGYSPAGCNICRPAQPDCAALGLGGQVDLSCAKKLVVGDPGQAGCGGGEHQDVGLCYKDCAPGYKGVGPVCWGEPPNGWSECGMGAAKDSTTCASVIFSQVSSVGQLAAFVASLGTDAVAEEAANAPEAAGKIAQLQQQYDNLKFSWEVLREGTPEIEQAIAVFDLANAGRQGYVAMDQLTTATTPEDMARASAEMAAIVDPTGVSSVIAAYTYPKCSKYFQPQNGQPTTTPPAGVQWVSGDDTTPKVVVAGTADGALLTPCRTTFGGYVRAGSLQGQTCQIGYWGMSKGVDNTGVLTNTADVLAWWPGPSISAGAVLVGQSDGLTANNQNLYVCRASYNGELYLGNTLDNQCKFGAPDGEVGVSDFEVLTKVPAQPTWFNGPNVPGSAVVTGPVQGDQVALCAANVTIVTTRVSATGARRSSTVSNAVLPGKVWNGACDIGWNGTEYLASSFQVLTSGTGILEWTAGPQIPTNAVKAGNTVICRGTVGSDVHPGAVNGNVCSIGWAGTAYNVAQFDVLTQH